MIVWSCLRGFLDYFSLVLWLVWGQFYGPFKGPFGVVL